MNKYHDPVIDERITQWRNEEKKDLDDILDVRSYHTKGLKRGAVVVSGRDQSPNHGKNF